MGDQQRWFKLWASAPEDPSLLALPPATRWAWAALGVYTKVHGTKGVLSTSSDNPVLSALMGVTASMLIPTIKLLPHITVEEGKKCDGQWNVTWNNWYKYQVDSSASRTSTWRRSKRRGEEKRISSASPPDVEHPPGEAVGADPSPGNGRGSAVPIDPQLVVWLQGTKNLRALGDPKRGDFWAALERAYDRYEWFYFEPEIAKMDAWIEANPNRRPTERGLPRFVRSWFERAVNMGRTKHGQG